jgi:hypothetical protein
MLNNIGLPGLLLLILILAVFVAALVRPRTPDTRRGSVVWLLVWAVVFFPFAIIYALMRRWSDPEEMN